MRYILLLLLITLLLAPWGFADGGGAAAPAAADLQNVERALLDARKGFYAERTRIRAEVAEAKVALAREGERKNALDQQAKSLNDDLAKLHEREAALVAKKKASDDALAALDKVVANGQKDLDTAIRTGLPVRVEDRLARFAASPEDASDPAAPLTRARRLLLALDEEIAAGSTAEVVPTEVTLADGRKKHARVLRLGWLAAFAVTDDAAEAGAYVPDGKGGWVLDQSVAVAPLDHLLRAMEMADRHSAGELVPLPLPVEKGGTR